MSWLNGFYDEDKGPIYDHDQVNSLYQYQGIAGCCGSFIFLGFVGTLTDKISAKILLPSCFLIRGVAFLLAYTIQDPYDKLFYTITPLLYVCQYSVVTILMSYLNKMYPRDIRGMMTSVQGLISKVGQLIFLQISLYLYHKNFALPFLGAAGMDFFITIVLIISICFFSFGEVIDEEELRILHNYNNSGEVASKTS
jgi:hypothetical protein